MFYNYAKIKVRYDILKILDVGNLNADNLINLLL